MKIRWRKNPKTEGWLKRIAISLLAAVAAFAVAAPLTFVLTLHHLHSVAPKDTESFLAAMTSAVAVGLLVAGLGFVTMISGLWLIRLRHSSPTT